MSPLINTGELNAPYTYVISEEAVQHAMSLLEELKILGESTSLMLSTSAPWQRRSILELRGLGKEVWEGIDPKRYIEELRNEWDTH